MHYYKSDRKWDYVKVGTYFSVCIVLHSFSKLKHGK